MTEKNLEKKKSENQISTIFGSPLLLKSFTGKQLREIEFHEIFPILLYVAIK